MTGASNTRKRRASANGTSPNAKRVQRGISSPKSSAQRGSVHNALPLEKLRVYVFGDETSGELGLSSKEPTEILAPRHNPKLDGVIGVATGGMHAAALTVDGVVLTWGVNDHYALGRKTIWTPEEDDDTELNPLESTPSAIDRDNLDASLKFVQVVASDSATFFLAEDGSVYGCGTFRDHNGILGFCCEKTARSTAPKFTKIQELPRRIEALQDIVRLCAGSDFVLALDARGVVYAWGDGRSYQLGRRHSSRASPTSTLTPMRVSFPRSTVIASIHTGNYHAFAIDTKGNTWAWGTNNFGQTGISETAGQDNAAVVVPHKVTALGDRRMKMISGGQHHSVGISTDGECLVWGRMDAAQTGIATSSLPIDDPTKVMRNEAGRPAILLEPTLVSIPKCAHVAAGSDHSLAVTEDGQVFSWGFNDGGQCGQGNDDDVETATLVGSKAIRGQRIIWAGAGGRYGMLGAALDS